VKSQCVPGECPTFFQCCVCMAAARSKQLSLTRAICSSHMLASIPHTCMHPSRAHAYLTPPPPPHSRIHSSRAHAYLTPPTLPHSRIHPFLASLPCCCFHPERPPLPHRPACGLGTAGARRGHCTAQGRWQPPVVSEPGAFSKSDRTHCMVGVRAHAQSPGKVLESAHGHVIMRFAARCCGPARVCGQAWMVRKQKRGCSRKIASYPNPEP